VITRADASSLHPRLQLLAAAVLFSTGGAAIKSCTLSSWQVACFRSGIAALALALMLPAARRAWSWRSLLVGTAHAATMVLFVSATKLTTSANAIFLQSTAPLYLLLLGPWLLHEPARRRDVVVMAVLATGLAMLTLGAEPISVSAPDPQRGNVVAAASGVAWAFTVLGLRWAGRAATPLAPVVAGNLLACLLCLPVALPLTGGAADWALLTYLGVVQIGLAYVFVTRAIRDVRALDAALLLLLEPVLNPVWAWLVHGEQPTAWSLAGGALIVGATGAKAWVDMRGGGVSLHQRGTTTPRSATPL
jgi:drug/metabolite transporter (DMT)-like permease